jgi:iron-sulfur cluster insertion protein
VITITNKAAIKAKTLINSGNYLRIYIQGGGCSGMKYVFELSNKEGNDSLFEDTIVIDTISLAYLEGSTIDYEESLAGDFFKITNPQAKTTCGCGESFGV